MSRLTPPVSGMFQPWKGLEAVEWATLVWIDGFNPRRRLEPVGYLPPAEAEAADYRRVSEPVMVT